jgi:hypothetical protein
MESSERFVALCDCLTGPVPYLNRTNNRYKIVKMVYNESMTGCVFSEVPAMADRLLEMDRDEDDDPLYIDILVCNIRADIRSIGLWRTPWAIYYKAMDFWIPIIDVTDNSVIPGTYIYGIKSDTTAMFTTRVKEQQDLRNRMMFPSVVPASQAAEPAVSVGQDSIVPSFIGDAIKRDAITKSASCPISLDEFTNDMAIVLTNCYHIFKEESLKTWLHTNDKCPLCMRCITSQQVL